MSALMSAPQENAANPLDVMEQIVAANDWVFDRRSDSEMAAEAPGKWCDYGLYFSWLARRYADLRCSIWKPVLCF